MTKLRSDDLLRLLRERPRVGSAELCARMGGINRSTLARHVKALGGALISRGGSRRTRYALRRALRGDSTPLPLYRVDEQGRGNEVGHLHLTYPEGSAPSLREDFPWPLDGDMADGWFDGLPYPLHDMRPQGFLGRNFAHCHALDLAVSRNPDEWSEDDITFVLATLGYDLPGNFILGEMAYRRFLDHRQAAASRFMAEAEVAEAYPRMAAAALAHGDVGSSAGGEFPKFTAGRIVADRPVDVIVKFSGADDTPAVRRWADLLVCEHLALNAVAELLQVPAAESAVLQHGGRTFLEVVRFDRHGTSGRSAVCTLQSLNAALIGSGGAPWPKVAAALRQAGWLSEADAGCIALIWWFGQLIANTDMHEGNLAFRPGLRLAPVYDMLPMLYAPLRSGELPAREFAPALPLPAEQPVWAAAAQAATEYWQRCSTDQRISAAFRQICSDNAVELDGMLARG